MVEKWVGVKGGWMAVKRVDAMARGKVVRSGSGKAGNSNR